MKRFQTDNWNFRPYPALEGEFADEVDQATSYIESQFKESYDEPLSPVYRQFSCTHETGALHLDLKIPYLDYDFILTGEIELPMKSYFPELPNNRRGEPGSLLFELRKTHVDIVNRNSTFHINPYIRDIPVNNSKPLTYRKERLGDIRVRRREAENLDKTIDALDRIARNIDDVYQDLIQTAASHRKGV